MKLPSHILLMGVSGCGKSTVGALLAERLGGEFIEGDDLHPPENKVKMGQGIPLQDEDRWPWFDGVRRILREGTRHPVITSCSALKRKYRDYLREGFDDLRLIHLRGGADLIGERLKDRQHEYMPASLLPSQFAAFEEPVPEEDIWVFPIEGSPGDIVTAIVERFSNGPG
ncbi:MAG: gluconokinase [Verrucomicrobiales bacterium]